MNISKKVILSLFSLLITANVNAKDISQNELKLLMQGENKPLLIDVRTELEYAKGHLFGAINISHTVLKQRLAELSGTKNHQVVLYCRSGKRAAVAEKILVTNGFTQVDHLIGDMIAWQKNGLPLVTLELRPKTSEFSH